MTFVKCLRKRTSYNVKLNKCVFFIGLVGTSLDFHKQKDYSFLVGTEHGKIHKVSHKPSQPRWPFILRPIMQWINQTVLNIYYALTNALWTSCHLKICSLKTSHYSSGFESGRRSLLCLWWLSPAEQPLFI